ncbi:MAG: LegC family aminotransferase [Candidatus Methylomirabilis sp.]|nr:LegC family aminotransferase [Deltaproteobacteria bacterium]
MATSTVSITSDAAPIRIALSEPEISGNEWKYVKECLDTGWVSSAGAFVTRFEKSVAAYTGAHEAVSTVNGTSALHVSMVALGVAPGDEVVVPAVTFVAPVNAVKYCGAEPVFMDCDPDTLCMNTAKLATFLKNECFRGKDGFTYNRTTKRRVKAVVPVHVFGHPARMDELVDACLGRDIEVIEDATESLGSEFMGKKTGTFGAAGCFSFNGNKVITTGGGGMVVTDDRALAVRLKHLTTQAKTDAFEYEHDEVGYNYRLTNMQAALGVAQLERLEEFVSNKRRNAESYRRLLMESAGLMWEKPWARSNFWHCTIRVGEKRRGPLIRRLTERGIQVRPLWKPVHLLPMYRGCQAYRIEHAEAAYRSCLNIPSGVALKSDEIEHVAAEINRALKGE